MKKINIAYFLAATALFCGCDNDKFLEEEPQTIYTVDSAFKKSSQVDSQLSTCYYQAYSLYTWIDNNIFGAFSGSASSTLLGYGADCIEGNASLANSGSAFSNYGTLDALDGHFLNVWNDLYTLAANANLALYGADQVQWESETKKSDLIAQAKFFLGWCYLRLGECYGGVPIVEEFSQELHYDYTRNTREEVYAFAIKNLQEAAAGLPDYPAEDGRLAKGAANHFLAEAYIAQAVETGNTSYLDQAIAAANVTIGLHPLMTQRFGVRANPADTGTNGMFGIKNYYPDGNVFFDLFQMGNYDRSEGNTEGLWVVETPNYSTYASFGGQRNNNVIGCAQPYRDLQWASPYKEANSGAGPWSADSNIDMNAFPYGAAGPYCGGGSWGMYGSNDYIDEYIWEGKYSEDIRNSQCILIDPVVMDQNHSKYKQIIDKNMLLEPNRYMRVSGKVNLPDAWGWDSHSLIMGQGPQCMYGRDNYAARSAETYLLKAEAQLRKGDAAEAAKTLNEVRKRAQCTYLYDETGKDIDIYTILDERARELSWEEHRWPTLLRMGKTGEENVVMHRQVLAHAQYVHDLPTYTSNNLKWSLFPIPLSVIQLNSEAELTQNPGWE
ncbi:MAG: RagB/SusD family nutrient uptake outer membrane protein [Bacteroidaceae bacterium]|nr:RagB/SusD family nutrient uptake outer membrane protein [Bacteroidaceae bacterium]